MGGGLQQKTAAILTSDRNTWCCVAEIAPATLDVVGMASQYVRGGIFFGRVRFDAFPFLHNAARVRGTCIEMPTKPIFGQSNRLAALPGV